VYIATSLDGFIARKDGAIDWLPVPQDTEDYGYGPFMTTVDAIVMGRRTFDLALTFEEWSYRKPVVVLTNRPDTLPATLPPKVRTLAGSPDEIVATLESDGVRHIYVDGGVTIQQFLEAGRIDRLIITTVPILLGSGVPLFGPLAKDIEFHHMQTRAFPDGLVQSEYRVIR
jgi:dihydrofolate reductase